MHRAALPEVVSQADVTGWDAVLALAVLILAWLLSKVAARATARLLRKVDGLSEELRSISQRCVKYAVIVLGIGVALSLLGAHVQPLLVAFLVIALVVALALRGIADNFGAGVVLQTRRPIKIGDEIEGLGHLGVVVELNSRAVVIRTYDGQTIHLPNSQLLDSALANNSIGEARRSEVQLRVRSTDRALLAAALELVRGVDGVLADPAADILLIDSDEHRQIATVRFWHVPTSGPQVSSAIVTALADEMVRRGIPAAITSQGLKPAFAPPDEV